MSKHFKDDADREVHELRLELARIKEEKENEIALLRSSHVQEIEKLEEEARCHLRLFESECATPEDQNAVTGITGCQLISGERYKDLPSLQEQMNSTVRALKLNHAKTLGRLLSQLAAARSEILQVKKQHGNMLHRCRSISNRIAVSR